MRLALLAVLVAATRVVDASPVRWIAWVATTLAALAFVAHLARRRRARRCARGGTPEAVIWGHPRRAGLELASKFYLSRPGVCRASERFNASAGGDAVPLEASWRPRRYGGYVLTVREAPTRAA